MCTRSIRRSCMATGVTLTPSSMPAAGRLATALARAASGGDTVAVMAPNMPALLEAHFGVPMTGAVLNALNIRLDAAAIAFSCEHGEAKVLITDREFAPVSARRWSSGRASRWSSTSTIRESPAGRASGSARSNTRRFLAGGDPDFAWRARPTNGEAIALNYTSGTTGNPKGVVYHHRGAYLNALGNALVWAWASTPVYLWTLPMFHCNGWCFPWTVIADRPAPMSACAGSSRGHLRAIAEHGVTHLCGAPIVMQPAGQCAGRAKRPARRHKVEVDDRGLGAAGGGDRGHGDARLRGHPCLRADRGLRPGGGLRLAAEWDALDADRAGRLQGAPGRALPGARRADGDGSARR